MRKRDTPEFLGFPVLSDPRHTLQEPDETRRLDERGHPVAYLQTLPCPTCGEDTDFEQPTCIDGHTEDGGDCPEWACTECGTALVIGGAPVVRSEVWHRAA